MSNEELKNVEEVETEEVATVEESKKEGILTKGVNLVKANGKKIAIAAGLAVGGALLGFIAGRNTSCEDDGYCDSDDEADADVEGEAEEVEDTDTENN